MRHIKIFQADAFTDKVFGGNPAAVCLLDRWLSDELMQQIAMENNLSETAFLVRTDGGYEIRWFTPVSEVELCGHATLASAHVLFTHFPYDEEKVAFRSRCRGELTVTKSGDLLTLDFPADDPVEISPPEWLTRPFNIQPESVLKGNTDYMLVYPEASDIEGLLPDFSMLGRTAARGVIVTAPGRDTDFVSRFFAPQVGINEDPVTGSAHTTLTPYWSRRLNKKTLTARQLSARKGDLTCEWKADRVLISGKAVTYLVGEIVV